MKRSPIVAVLVLTLSALALSQPPTPPKTAREPKRTAGKEKEPEAKTDEGGKTVDPPAKSDEKVPGKVPEPAKKDPMNPRPVRGASREPVDPKKDPARVTPEKAPREPMDPKKDPMGPTRMPRTPAKVPMETEKTAVQGLPMDFEAQQRQAYRKVDPGEVSFEQFFESRKQEFVRLRGLEKNPASRYRREGGRAHTVCGNGDFEPGGLNTGEWSGGYGSVLPGGVVDFPNFTAGISQGLITVGTARQTAVSAGIDPNVGIQMTGPNSSTNVLSTTAVRIGNAVSGSGAELLAKKFTVTSSDTSIRFWYAVVLQNPGHTAPEQPAFQVRVLESGVVVPNLVDLGNGTSKLIADAMNPFLVVKPGTPLLYKDWSCAQINLSTLVGKTVTIEFVTQDCSQGGHFGYAYVDTFCGTCKNDPTGDVQFDTVSSTTCGKGKLCFNYTLPLAGGVTGTGLIALDVYQNGVKLQTLTSPTLSAGTSHCFAIDPAGVSGMAPGGFDFVATGTFTLGTNIKVLTVGTAPHGRVAGKDNDYLVSCGGGPVPVAGGCCPGKNIVVNGEFNEGPQPHSQYQQAAIDKLVPGSYSVAKLENLAKACRNWQVPAACAKTGDFSGSVMVINGLTSQPAGTTSVIWEQKLTIDKAGDYRLCFKYLPLPQCCFDIQATPSVVVNGPNGNIPLTGVSDVATGCGHLYSATFTAGAGDGYVNLQIVLPGDGSGDGNDAIFDNISVVRIEKVAPALLLFGLIATDAGNGTYTVALTAPAGLTTPPYYTWVWELWDPTSNTLTTSIAGNAATASFPGLMPATPYLFKCKAWSNCNALTGSKQTWSYDPTRKSMGKTVEDTEPEPVKVTKPVRVTKRSK